MNEETEIQRFERLCKEVGVPITTINFHISQEQIYKLYRAIIKDCEQNDNQSTYLVEKPKVINQIGSSKEAILRQLRKRSFGLTSEELSHLAEYSLRTIQDNCNKLKKEGLIEEGAQRGLAKVWKIKK